VRAGESGEFDDGPSPRGSDAAGSHHEREGGVRAVGEDSSPGASDEGAQPASVGVREEAEEDGSEGDLPRAGRASAAPASEINGQHGLRLRRASLHRHGNRG